MAVVAAMSLLKYPSSASQRFFSLVNRLRKPALKGSVVSRRKLMWCLPAASALNVSAAPVMCVTAWKAKVRIASQPRSVSHRAKFLVFSIFSGWAISLPCLVRRRRRSTTAAQVIQLFEQCFDNLVIGDSGDFSSLSVYEALVFSGTDGEVCVCGFARAVDNTSHDGDAEGFVDAGCGSSNFSSEPCYIDMRAGAGWADNKLDGCGFVQAEGGEDLLCDFGFDEGVTGGAYPDGVTDAFGEECPESDGRGDLCIFGQTCVR